MPHLESPKFDGPQFTTGFFHQVSADIELKAGDLNHVLSGINNVALEELVAKGWNNDELNDLLTVIFNAKEEIRIGVFGSMSRGKQGIATTSDGKLANENSDIDILIITKPNYPEEILITEYPGLYSKRPINIFAIKNEGYAKFMFGKDYASTIWIYNEPAKSIAQTDDILYRFMYGY